MDGNYEMNSIAFSLKTMCTTKVAHQVLVASGIKSSDISMQTSIVMDAMKRIKQLELPATLIKMVEALIGPLKFQLDEWYLLSPEDPIFTPQGIVDFVQGVRVILANENVDAVNRFTLACNYCIEEVIFKMFDQLDLRNPCSALHLLLQESTLLFVDFWFAAVLYQSDDDESGNHLNVEAYCYGFKLALRLENDVAIRYFIDKADVEKVRSCILNWRLGLPIRPILDLTMIPSTFCLLFSKLSTNEREHEEHFYLQFLLTSLMSWPYQGFLTEHVLSFTKHLKPFQIFDLISDLIDIIQFSEKQHLNYHKVMDTFLELHAKLNYERHSAETSFIVYAVLACEDELLVNIVLHKLSTNYKDKLLTDVHTNVGCMVLVRQMDFQILKIFIRVCVMGRKCMLSMFKLNFLKFAREFMESKSLDEKKKLEVETQMVVKILDEIASEKPPLNV